MRVHVGTSGWQYRDWRPAFYPRGLGAGHWLEYYAERFATVESNRAFYRLPTADVFATWAARTPDDFVMAVKVSRFLTHVKRLLDPDEPVSRFVERASHLGSKLGPVLLQLPPQLTLDGPRLDAALSLFPPNFRVAVEFRHESWFTEEIRQILVNRKAALCLTDRGGPRSPLWATADWTYVRFHEGRASPRPCYGKSALRAWADLLRAQPQWHEAWVYFNNDHRACALRDAAEFAVAAVDAGLLATRVPSVDDVHLAR